MVVATKELAFIAPPKGACSPNRCGCSPHLVRFYAPACIKTTPARWWRETLESVHPVDGQSAAVTADRGELYAGTRPSIVQVIDEGASAIPAGHSDIQGTRRRRRRQALGAERRNGDLRVSGRTC